MPFDFITRVQQLRDQKRKNERQEAQQRDRRNEIAREIVRGLLGQYAGQLGDQFASVEGNVVTITRPGGTKITVTVLGENEFTLNEHGGTGGQQQALDKTGMMDAIIESFAEEGI